MNTPTMRSATKKNRFITILLYPENLFSERTCSCAEGNFRIKSRSTQGSLILRGFGDLRNSF
jgi:hypothetical protein